MVSNMQEWLGIRFGYGIVLDITEMILFNRLSFHQFSKHYSKIVLSDFLSSLEYITSHAIQLYNNCILIYSYRISNV